MKAKNILLILPFLFSINVQAEEDDSWTNRVSNKYNRIWKLITPSESNGDSLFDYRAFNASVDSSGLEYFYQTAALGDTSNTIFLKSTTEGKQWERFSAPSQECRFVVNITVNPIDSKDILLPCLDHVFRSIDAGESWKATVLKPDTPNLTFTYTADGKTLYGVSRIGSNIFFNRHLNKYEKGKSKWKESSSKIEWTQANQSEVHHITTHPKNPLVVYIVASENDSTGVYKTTDGGNSWQRKIGAISGIGAVSSLLIHPYYPERLLFVDGSSLSLSDDGGSSWQALPLLPFSDPDPFSFGSMNSKIIFNPKNRDGIFYAPQNEGYVLETKDLGESWLHIETGLVFINSGSNTYRPSLKVKATSNAVFASSSKGSYKLTIQAYTSEQKDCLFNWAEQQYPALFSPALANAQTIKDYSYRYYANTNTYLGFFQDDEIHYLEANKSTEIKNAGFMEQYMYLSGCDN